MKKDLWRCLEKEEARGDEDELEEYFKLSVPVIKNRVVTALMPGFINLPLISHLAVRYVANILFRDIEYYRLELLRYSFDPLQFQLRCRSIDNYLLFFMGINFSSQRGDKLSLLLNLFLPIIEDQDVSHDRGIKMSATYFRFLTRIKVWTKSENYYVIYGIVGS